MEQIRQRWWVVVVVAVLTLVAVVAPSALARPTYVGKTTLTLPGLSPVDGALVMVGYMTIFNDPATIARLTATAHLPGDVTFEAKTVAASPILSIEATAHSPDVAQDAAEQMAGAFRADINSVPQTGAEKLAAELQRQLSVIAPLAPDGSVNPYFVALQNRIDDARSNSSVLLQELQPRAGVTEHAPRIVSALVRGAAGGLVLGILAALGLAAVSTRLRDSADLQDKTGVESLVEIPDTGSVKSHSVRQDRLRALANLVNLKDSAKPKVIALTDSRGGRAARDIAAGLAELSAQQGRRTVLIYADNDPSQPPGGAGFNDALAHSGLVLDVLKDGPVESLKILPAGSILADRYPLLTREKIVAILNELRTGADTIIVVAPSTAQTAEAQPVCAAADVTILVVTKGSRAGEVTSAAQTLQQAHAVLLGAVLIDKTAKRRTRPSPANQPPPPSANPDDRFTDTPTTAWPANNITPSRHQ